MNLQMKILDITLPDTRLAGYEPVDNTIEARQLAKSILGLEPPIDFDEDADDVA